MKPVLICESVGVTYPARGERASHEALCNIDVEIALGRTLGIVGESGAGKSTLVRVLGGFLAPTTGRVQLGGADFGVNAHRDRRRRVQVVLQNPASSLDPRFTVERSVAEGLRLHGIVPRTERRGRVVHWLERVGLSSDLLWRLPHELSGGQAQRVAIARALAVEPDIIVLDEPTASVDEGTAAGLLELIAVLREGQALAVVVVSHDLGVIRALADDLAIIHGGRIVERGSASDLYVRPAHPYTKALLRAASGEVAWVSDEPVDQDAVPAVGGCRYRQRCEVAEARCRDFDPPLEELVPGRAVACPVNAEKWENR